MPAWFLPDSHSPNAIFEAWRHLSTRDAAVYWTRDWRVLGGVLKDEQGHPLPHTPMSVTCSGTIRGFSATFATDAHGRFLVYGPHSLTPELTSEEMQKLPRTDWRSFVPVGIGFRAHPGYPFSQAAYNYAESRPAPADCRLRVAYKSRDRAFFVLTTSGKSSFDPASFRRFTEAEARKAAPKPTLGQIFCVGEGEAPLARRIEYPLHLVTASLKDLAHATILFPVGGHLVARPFHTNAYGRCTVYEAVAEGQAAPVQAVHRTLAVDAPGVLSGPVSCDLRTGAENQIQLPVPATLSGEVRDHHGNPLRVGLGIYCGGLPFRELGWIPQRADGTFSFSHLMPGTPLQLLADWHEENTTRISTRTPKMLLRPGEHRRTVIRIPLAASLRGVVVDERGMALTDPEHRENNWVSLLPEGDAGAGMADPIPDGRFCLSPVDQETFRLQVRCGTDIRWRSGRMHLQPGEQRFLTIRLEGTPK